MDGRDRILAAALALAGALVAAPAGAQTAAKEATATSGVVHVMGLDGIPRNAKGELQVSGGALHFTRGGTGRDAMQFELALAMVDEVYTADDSQRVIRGTLQTLSTFAPYGGGRFLSLFRTKIDLLTIEYRDAAGARHGVIFTLPDGKAAEMKQQMLAAGARSSVPVVPADEKKEQKP